MEKTIQMELTLDEVNAILGALGNLPYVQVFGLIQKVQQQARSQVEENTQVSNPSVKPEPAQK